MHACSWSEVVEASTKIDPVDGGGRGPDDMFTWTQNATEVCMLFKVSIHSFCGVS